MEKITRRQKPILPRIQRVNLANSFCIEQDLYEDDYVLVELHSDKGKV